MEFVWFRDFTKPGETLMDLLDSILQRESLIFGPVFKWHMSEVVFVNISDPDFGKLIASKGQKVFGKEDSIKAPLYFIKELFGPNIFSEKSDSWLKHRRALDPSFSQSSVGYVVSCTNQVMKQFDLYTSQRKGIIDADIMSNVALDVLGKAGFDHEFEAVSKDGMSEICQATGDLFRISRIYSLIPTLFLRKRLQFGPLKKMHDAVHIFSKTMDQLIQSRQGQSTDKKDILSRLLNATSEEEHSNTLLNHKELLGDLFLLLAAGQETTGRAMTFCLYLLCKNPQIQQKAQQVVDSILQGREPQIEDMDKLEYIHLLMKETLRLYPVAPGIVRVIEEDLNFKGYFIPKDTMISYVWSPTGRDSKHWGEDVKEFKPERFQDKIEENSFFTPFGVGARICIGRVFARYEFITAMTHILQHYTVELENPDFELRTEIPMTMCFKERFNFKLVPRK